MASGSFVIVLARRGILALAMILACAPATAQIIRGTEFSGPGPVAAAPRAPARLFSRFTRPAPGIENGASDEPVMYDPGVRRTEYVAQYDYPDEPLGFSGAMVNPGSPVDPGRSEGMFETEIYAPIEEPMDLDAPAPAVSSGEWVKSGYWYTHQSVVYMNRSANTKNSIILAKDIFATPLPHDNFFLQVPLGMGFEPGWRSTIGRFIGRDYQNRDHALEFTFTGLTHWGASGGLTSLTGNGLFTPIDPSFRVPVFNGSSQQTFNQTSDFNSYELNYRIDRRLARDRMIYTRDSTWVRQAKPALLPSLYAGIRVVDVNETLSWFAQSLSPAGHGSYLVATNNTLVGPQVGLDVFYERTDFRLGIRTKGAMMVNWDWQSSHVRILDNAGNPLSPNRDEFQSAHDAAFVGELNFIGSYNVRQNIALRAGFDLMWVTNIALAQNQLTFVQINPPEISDGHSLFYQGLSIGLEITR